MTGRFSSGSPPKNVSDELLGAHPVELALDPVADPGRRLDRHLVGELVVVAVVALEAVVAGEVALQRRQHRDVQLRRVARDRGQDSCRATARSCSRPAARNPLSTSRSNASRASRVERPRRRPAPSSSAATSDDTTSCASVSVFIRNTSSLGERHTEVEDGRLHADSSIETARIAAVELKDSSRVTERPDAVEIDIATRIPLHASGTPVDRSSRKLATTRGYAQVHADRSASDRGKALTAQPRGDPIAADYVLTAQ